jgi:hypothetical protein
VTHAPDFGFNVRWEPGDLGHVQFGTIFRSIGARNTTMGNQNVFGWGIDLATVLAVTPRDTATLWGVYGTGIGGMGNDTSFVNSDAAFDAAGNLHALDYASALAALTHNWTDRWRSTATFGAVYLANTSGQEADAYHRTYYASGNLVYQLFKRLSVGGEVLYGYRRVRSGDSGDVVRFQVGAVYSVFD